MSLKHQTLSGIFWSILQKVGSRGILFISTLVLARILSPKEFGLIGMLTVFIAISQALVDGGFNQALIQKEKTSEVDYSSVFYINLIVGIALYFVFYFGAPLIANFYRQPKLVDMTRVLSFVFVVNAFSYVQEARLTKEMSFKKLAIIHLPSSLIAGSVSIIMAIIGYGVWSIVALQLVMRVAYAMQIWFYAKWKPLFVFDRASAKRLFSFGSRLMLSNILSTIYQNIYLLVIGRFFPLASVGYYQNANNLVQQPIGTFTSSLNNVTFPAFATIQNDDVKLKKGYKKTVEQLLFWICPVAIVAIIMAQPLFKVLFTEKWLPAVPYFQILCLGGILYPLNVFNLNILNVKGRSDLFLKLEIIKRIIVTLGIIASIPLGIWALIIFQSVNTVIAYVINSHYSGKFINYPMKEQLYDIIPIVMISIITGIIVFLLDHFLFTLFPDYLRLIVGGICFAMIYYIICRLRKLPAYLDFVDLISNSMIGRRLYVKI